MRSPAYAFAPSIEAECVSFLVVSVNYPHWFLAVHKTSAELTSAPNLVDIDQRDLRAKHAASIDNRGVVLDRFVQQRRCLSAWLILYDLQK